MRHAEDPRGRVRGRPRLPLRLHARLVAALEGDVRGRRRPRRDAVPRPAGRVAVVARRAEPDLSRGRVVPGGPRRARAASRAIATCGGRSRTPRSRRSTGSRARRSRRWVTPRWKRHLERLVERERPDAVVVFTIPMAHLRGIPDALRERFGIPIVFYDGDVPMSLPGVRRDGHGLQPVPRRRSVGVRPRRSRTPRAGSGGCSSSARGAPRRSSGRADPEFFAPQPVEKEVDVFFYGYGDKFRRDWMKTMVGEPSRLAPELDFALGGLDFQGDTGAARGCSATSRSTSSRARSRRRASTST